MSALLANATPAPGSSEGLPAPKGIVAAPVVEPVIEPVVPVEGAPVVEPVAPVVETPALLEEPAVVVEPVVAAVAVAPPTPTGNAKFDQVAELLAAKNVVGYEAILSEAAAGEISLTNKAALVEALGADVAQLVMGQLDTEITAQRATGAAEGSRLKEYASEKFGGTKEQAEESWTVLAAFAKSEASGLDTADRTALNKMLQSGGKQGEWAINQLHDLYKKSSGFQSVPSLISGDGPTQSSFTPLSRQDYQAQIGPAIRKFGEGSREVAALRNNRSVSKQRNF